MSGGGGAEGMNLSGGGSHIVIGRVCLKSNGIEWSGANPKEEEMELGETEKEERVRKNLVGIDKRREGGVVDVWVGVYGKD